MNSSTPQLGKITALCHGLSRNSPVRSFGEKKGYEKKSTHEYNLLIISAILIIGFMDCHLFKVRKTISNQDQTLVE